MVTRDDRGRLRTFKVNDQGVHVQRAIGQTLTDDHVVMDTAEPGPAAHVMTNGAAGQSLWPRDRNGGRNQHG